MEVQKQKVGILLPSHCFLDSGFERFLGLCVLHECEEAGTWSKVTLATSKVALRINQACLKNLSIFSDTHQASITQGLSMYKACKTCTRYYLHNSLRLIFNVLKLTHLAGNVKLEINSCRRHQLNCCWRNSSVTSLDWGLSQIAQLWIRRSSQENNNLSEPANKPTWIFDKLALDGGS